MWGVYARSSAHGRHGRSHRAIEAKRFATETLLGRQVRLILAPARSRDDSGCLLAYAALEDEARSFNELLLARGYAYADRWCEHPFKSQYQALERRARKQGLGLWARTEPD
jgi:endonuclease YncB( thermonuclease family)